MSRKITLCLHALYLMYPLTSYGSATLYGVDLMDKSSVESKSVDTVPDRRRDKGSAIGSGLIQSDYQPQHQNIILSSEVDKISRNEVDKISRKSKQVIRPRMSLMKHQSGISGIMTPKTISPQNSPKAMFRHFLQDSFKLIRDKKPLDQEEKPLYNQDRLKIRNSSHSDHSEDHLKKLKIKESQSNILNDKNKPLQRADRPKVVQAINANLECTDCLQHPIQDLMLQAIGSYNENILKNDVYVKNMRKPYIHMMESGWTVLKENDQYIGEKAKEYLQEVSEYLDMYNLNGIRGGSRFKSMIDDAIRIKNILYPEPKPKGVVGAIYDALNQPDPEMTRRITHWSTKASNKIIEFGEQNLRANYKLDQLYYASLERLSALQKKSTGTHYNAPEFVSLKTETNDIFNQLEIKAQELGIDNGLLVEARQKIMNIGGDKKDQDLCLYKKIARSAPHDVNDFHSSKTYYRNHFQDDANEMTIKVPQGRKVEIY